MHVTSLVGAHATGDLGTGARMFIDWLAAADCRYWQMLPVNPTDGSNSPYSGSSAFAGNPTLINLADLVEAKMLRQSELPDPVVAAQVDYPKAKAVREVALKVAFSRFTAGPDYLAFEQHAASWLEDHALFEALQRAHPGRSWTQWPEALRRRDRDALAEARERYARDIGFVKFQQFIFAEQWARLARYAHEHDVKLIGDIPLFVAHESADVWAHQELFYIDDAGLPERVAGVPPDYFSKTGQRWGNPLYRWKRMKHDGYRWWIDRFRTLLERFDLVRLDHFLGFSRYWEIPASEPTAEHGRWKRGPGKKLFRAAQAQLGTLPFIAEDLGEITEAVRELRDAFAMPGMRVFQFAFGTDSQADQFRPYRYPENSVAYSGTHDNDTITGWFADRGEPRGPRSEAQATLEREAATEYLVGPAGTLSGPVHHHVMRTLYASPADTVILPLQDVLGLDNSARMNRPGEVGANWQWRVDPALLTPAVAKELRDLARIYGRAGRT